MPAWPNLIRKAALPLRIAARSQEIGVVFASYGLGGLLTSLGIEGGKRGFGIRKTNTTPFRADEVVGRNLVRTLVQLGPTFIKLGQILATRPDIVGDSLADQLKVLLDRVPPISFRKVKRILIRELGKNKFKEWFKEIEEEPLASASLSQTHRAKLKDGTEVILKVQKPGAGTLVRLDLALIEAVVFPLHAIRPKYQLMHLFDDFKAATLREIDYLQEAKNIDRFLKNHRKLVSISDVAFPRYYPDLTTSQVITLEPMRGKKMAELKTKSAAAKKAAAAGLTSILEQIFDHGFFHADPHAGNLFFLEETGRIGFIDLGLVGQLEEKDRQRFLRVLLAVLKKDRPALAGALYELATPNKKTNKALFEKEIDALIDDLKTKGFENLRLDEVVGRLLSIARTHSLHLPSRYIMMLRSCLLMEGVAKSLDPELSLAELATPIIAKSMLRTYSPLRWLRR